LPAKLSTTVSKIKLIPCSENADIVFKFYDFMKYNGASERHQNNNLKAVISYSNFLGGAPLKDISKKENILSYIQTKINTVYKYSNSIKNKIK
jgi:hypothetical protein